MNTRPVLPAAIRSVSDLALVEAASRRHQVPCGDGTMVWHSWGEGSPIVLLHGGSGSWTHWVRNIAALVAAGRSVWIPDLPGFGDSARPPVGGDADALPGPLEAAMAALLGDAPVDLVGFSFGSMVAAFIAAQHPSRVRRLVLSGAPALGVRPVEPLVLKAWGHLPPGPELDAAHRENLARLMLARPDSIDALALAIYAANLSRDRMRMRRISRTDILLRTLPEVRCPVHGIWGEEDVLYRGVQHLLAPALSAAPDFRGLAMISGAGHWVQFEDAPAFDRALAQALAH
ncbi:alpha/beta fold hydrolase [Burkholderiaceae bacterium FT117]|uniref:alpha/beta fold hydrolase n=1 Tax=Zeimonas sediminis TaxID=2944268 RepID=UPI00234303AD|nr:alpha/beta fold hydrolase [Zeimonas sediminis]MCM5571885.1 alpha/beta fold hydrolase [Zeimonas sediminis]